MVQYFSGLSDIARCWLSICHIYWRRFQLESRVEFVMWICVIKKKQQTHKNTRLWHIHTHTYIYIYTYIIYTLGGGSASITVRIKKLALGLFINLVVLFVRYAVYLDCTRLHDLLCFVCARWFCLSHGLRFMMDLAGFFLHRSVWFLLITSFEWLLNTLESFINSLERFINSPGEPNIYIYIYSEGPN